jgi:TonB family protein
MKDANDARLAQALLCSVLAHFLLLSVARLPPPLADARSSEGLTVGFHAAPAASAAMSSVAAAPEPEVAPPPLLSVPSPRPPLLRRPPATPPERPPVRAERAAAFADAPNAAEAASGDEAARTGMGEGAGQTGTAGQGAIAAAGEAAAGVADMLPAYFMAIGENARKLRRYPARARELGHEGRMEILLIWRPGMGAPQVALQQGSGSALLDRQGLSMLRQAAALTPLPEALRHRAFSLVLPVEFSLEQPEPTAR